MIKNILRILFIILFMILFGLSSSSKEYKNYIKRRF